MYDHLEALDRFAKRGLWMCLLWPMLAAPAPWLASPAMPPELVGVSNITIEEFDIGGRTLEEISDSLTENLLHDPDVTDNGAAAMTYNWLDWSWDSKVDDIGTCHVSNAKVTTRFKIILPRLASSHYAPEVLRRWRQFRRAIEMHEARHVLITRDYARQIERELTASSCAEAESNAEKLKLRMNLAQEAFDGGTCDAYHAGNRSREAIDECVYPYLEAPLSDPTIGDRSS